MLVNETTWESVLKGKDWIWQIFKEAFLRAQELSIPRCKKSGKEGKRMAWLRGRQCHTVPPGHPKATTAGCGPTASNAQMTVAHVPGAAGLQRAGMES